MSEITFGPMHVERARALVDQVREAVVAARAAIVELHDGRAWEPLGYGSWDELCEAEFGLRLHLSAGERPALVADLTDAGLGVRAIGSALGVGIATVSRDNAARVPKGTRGPTLGLDGKHYRPRPALPSEYRVTAEPVPTPLADAERERTRMVRRLAPLWHNTTTNLLDAMREAVHVRGLDNLLDDDLGLGNMRELDVQRLREIAAAATALADYLDRRLRRVQ